MFIFYEEPDVDRWFSHDRIPRKFLRRLIRGPAKPGGVMRWFLNLKSGLDQLGVKYSVNDYRGLARNKGAWAHVIGKPHVVEKIPLSNPIIFGPGVAAHPLECDFWNRNNLRAVILSCDWFREMYARDLPRSIPLYTWPAGIDSERWKPTEGLCATNEIILYDKVRWERPQYDTELIQPIIQSLKNVGARVRYFRYGSYEEEHYHDALKCSKAMIFLCEHETQGFAYLQALAMNVPILAWDRRGMWKDPSMFPHRVQFGPVTSVPYFDHRCGAKFSCWTEFAEAWPVFLRNIQEGDYQPREYILDKFKLAERAQEFMRISREIQSSA